MTPRQRQRLILTGLLLAGVGAAVGLTLTALRQNINLFYSPAQVAAGEVPAGSTFRLGGIVVDGSVHPLNDDLGVVFSVTDTAATVSIRYRGILPDLFREGQGIVALGRWQDNRFVAEQVLAKHDETYMPPEVSAALEQANRRQYSNAVRPQPGAQ